MADRLTDEAGLRRERRSHLPGWVLVVVTLALFVTVPVGVYAVARLMQVAAPLPGLDELPPLDYAQRFEWDALPVTAGTYERGPTSRARTNERFKDRGFHPSDAWLDDLPVLLESAGALRAAAAVGEPMAADAPPRVEALEALAAEHPEWFYPAYLTAERYRLGGEAQAAERWMAESFARAEAALVLPAASGAAVALGFDEVNEDGNTLDRSLVLVYPAPLAEADGRAYLPAHKAMIRIADPDVPFAPPPRPDAPSWLTWPGRVGVLPPAG